MYDGILPNLDDNFLGRSVDGTSYSIIHPSSEVPSSEDLAIVSEFSRNIVEIMRDTLTEREFFCVCKYYGVSPPSSILDENIFGNGKIFDLTKKPKEETYTSIGRVIGSISRERVRQIINSGINKLQQHFWRDRMNFAKRGGPWK